MYNRYHNLNNNNFTHILHTNKPHNNYNIRQPRDYSIPKTIFTQSNNGIYINVIKYWNMKYLKMR